MNTNNMTIFVNPQSDGRSFSLQHDVNKINANIRLSDLFLNLVQMNSIVVIVVLCLILLSATVFFIETGYHGSKVQRPPPAIVVSPEPLPHPKVESQPPIRTSEVSKLVNPEQKSKFAYVTLISGIDKSFQYRGFLYNTLIMRKALVALGSTADFVALIGYHDAEVDLFEEDINLLKKNGISVFILPRLRSSAEPLSFAEMALLKVTPWSFTQYEKVQFFDGDVMPTQNMDCFFSLPQNSFTVGAVSPLNSGWYLALPNQQDFEALRRYAVWRLDCDWDSENGWGKPLSELDLTYRGGKRCTEWEFNGADMDQGLLTHHFVLSTGRALLVDTDTKQARLFQQGLVHGADHSVSMSAALSCCKGLNPTSFFAHFTGRSKPWIQPKVADSQAKAPGRVNWSVKIWMDHLDGLHLPVNSSNIYSLGLGSPLGYFNANFRKRGKACVVEDQVTGR